QVSDEMAVAIAATVELRRADGAVLGRARAAFTTGPALVNGLSRASGVDVTIVRGAVVNVSTLPGTTSLAVARAVESGKPLEDQAQRELVLRTLEPRPGQPLTVALTTPR